MGFGDLTQIMFEQYRGDDMVKEWLVPVSDKKQGQIVSSGQHLATIVTLADLGIQKTTYEGETRSVQQLLVVFELHDEFMEDGEHKGKPMQLNKTYSLTFGKKSNLRKELINKVEGKVLTDDEIARYSLSSLLGKGVDLTVAHKTSKTNGLTYANIVGVSPLRKSDKLPSPVAKLVMYRTDDHNETDFQSLPEWVREKVNVDKPDYSKVTDASKF